jgi:hypothetical protein
VCPTCGAKKPVKQFTVYKVGVREYRHKTCNSCRARWNALTPAKRRNLALIEQAKSRPCQRCVTSYPTVCMELVPRPPLKRKVSTIWRWSTERKLREHLAQCDVFCEHCRRLIAAGFPSADLAIISGPSPIKSAVEQSART